MFAHAIQVITEVPTSRTRGSHLADTALVLAAIAVTPLILFALLWCAVLLTLGGMWLWSLVALV